MNFKQQLEAELSRKNTDYIVYAAGKNPKHFQELMLIVLKNEEPYSSRAAWAIDVICENHINLIYPYISKIIEKLPVFHHFGTCRHMLRILEKVSIPDDHVGRLIDFCFDTLLKSEIPVAIKIFGMQIIAKLLGVFLTDSPDFFNNRVVTHG